MRRGEQHGFVARDGRLGRQHIHGLRARDTRDQVHRVASDLVIAIVLDQFLLIGGDNYGENATAVFQLGGFVEGRGSNFDNQVGRSPSRLVSVDYDSAGSPVIIVGNTSVCTSSALDLNSQAGLSKSFHTIGRGCHAGFAVAGLHRN